ncbi:hypothetical protein GQ457_15G010520 [Hibiscus cannabinus]
MVVYIKRLLLENVAIIEECNLFMQGTQFYMLILCPLALDLSPLLFASPLPVPPSLFSLPLPFILRGFIHTHSFCRSQWPNRLTLKFITQLVLISFRGYCSNYSIGTAMSNLAPGLIFIIAWAFRLKKVVLSCLYNKVKIAGTFFDQYRSVYNGIFNKNKIIGCMYLMAAVLVLSSNVVLQAKTLGDFPAPMSLCAITSLIGVIITSLVQLFEIHDLEWGSPLVSGWDLLGFSLLVCKYVSLFVV